MCARLWAKLGLAFRASPAHLLPTVLLPTQATPDCLALPCIKNVPPLPYPNAGGPVQGLFLYDSLAPTLRNPPSLPAMLCVGHGPLSPVQQNPTWGGQQQMSPLEACRAEMRRKGSWPEHAGKREA